jgi:hypothetical protein
MNSVKQSDIGELLSKAEARCDIYERRIAELEHTIEYLRGHVTALKRALVAVLNEDAP